MKLFTLLLAPLLVAAAHPAMAATERVAKNTITASTSARNIRSLCTREEVVVFSCTAGKKQISMCASRNFTEDVGYLQYRYGTGPKIEISIPADVPPKTLPAIGLVFLSGGGGEYFNFQAGSTRYVVFSVSGAGVGAHEGVLVMRDGFAAARHECTTPSTGNFDILNKGGEYILPRQDSSELESQILGE